MPACKALIATPEASRLIKRLLTHWGHKFETTFDERHGEVPFDADTRALFDADEAALAVRIQASDAARLARMQEVVAEHLQRMARASTLEITWHPDAN